MSSTDCFHCYSTTGTHLNYCTEHQKITIPSVPEDAIVPCLFLPEEDEANDVPIGFVTKDSGKREQFDSGMVRDTQEGKIQYDLIFDGPMLKRYAELLTRGAVKYAARNWMKASGQAELDRFKSSAIRHFIQWVNGDTDEDHAAAVWFNLNGAEYLQEKLKCK